MNINRMKQLRKEIEANNRAYYIEDTPKISDYDYDKLIQELIDLEKLHPEL